MLIDSSTASCCIVPALLAPLLPQIYMSMIHQITKMICLASFRLQANVAAAVSAACPTRTGWHQNVGTRLLQAVTCLQYVSAVPKRLKPDWQTYFRQFKHALIVVGLQAIYATTRLINALLSFQHHSAYCAGPFTAWQVALPTKAIHVKAADKDASVAAAAAAGSAAAGHLSAPPTPLKTPPYSALLTPRTPVLLDAFGRGDSTITYFAPPESKLAADHTLKTLGLAFNMYETFLGCKFPYKALQTVSCSTLSHGEPIIPPREEQFRVERRTRNLAMSQLQQLPVYILSLAMSVTPVCVYQIHAYLRKWVKVCYKVTLCSCITWTHSPARKLFGTVSFSFLRTPISTAQT